LAGVEIAVKKKKITGAVFFVVFPKALVDPAVVVGVNAVVVGFAGRKLADVEIPVFEGQLPVSGEI
jgi:hypothetical protein